MLLNRDGALLFCCRFIRLYSFGALSLALILYLQQLGFTLKDISLLLTCTLLGDLPITLFLTTRADSFGRRKVLLISAVLKCSSGIVFATCGSSWNALLLAATLGVISPTGNECGPFVAVEQAALTDSLSDTSQLAKLFGIYSLVGYIAQACGALNAGLLVSYLQVNDSPAGKPAWTPLEAYRSIMFLYAVCGGILFCLYAVMSSDIEPAPRRFGDSFASEDSTLSQQQRAGVFASLLTWFGRRFGLHRRSSRRIIFKLSALFSIDAFAGGLVLQSVVVFWFSTRWQMNAEHLGALIMGANLLSGFSALLATPLVHRIGAVPTMVFTHLPSNVFLLLVPLMPTQSTAIAMLMLRHCLSQMDVPARSTFIALSVDSDERSAASGITNLVRTCGLSLSPLLLGQLLSQPANYWLFSSPFLIAGGLKCVYDVLLYTACRLESASQLAQQKDYTSIKQVSDQKRSNGQANGNNNSFSSYNNNGRNSASTSISSNESNGGKPLRV